MTPWFKENNFSHKSNLLKYANPLCAKYIESGRQQMNCNNNYNIKHGTTYGVLAYDFKH